MGRCLHCGAIEEDILQNKCPLCESFADLDTAFQYRESFDDPDEEFAFWQNLIENRLQEILQRKYGFGG